MSELKTEPEKQKYELIRDLPGIKAGQVRTVDSDGDIRFDYNHTEDDSYFFNKKEVSQMLGEGWLKKIKNSKTDDKYVNIEGHRVKIKKDKLIIGCTEVAADHVIFLADELKKLR